MIRALQFFVLCTFSYVGSVDIFIDGPVILHVCRSQNLQANKAVKSTRTGNYGQVMVESTTAKLITEDPIDPDEFYEAICDGDLPFVNAAISQLSTSGRGLNWNITTSGGNTALHIAVGENQTDIVAALLDAGANPDVQSKSGWTPIHFATRYKYISPLRILLDPKYQADINLQDAEGQTPVYAASLRDNTEVLELLLANGGDPNKVNNDGSSPLLEASWRTGQVETVRMLIQAGAHVDYERPGYGHTALHSAAMYRNEDIIRVLLENGADKNKQDKRGQTPADFARRYGNEQLVQLIENY